MTYIAKGKTLKEFAAHLTAGGDIEPIVVELELRSSNEDKGSGYRERNAKALAQVVETGQLADLKAVWSKGGTADETADVKAVQVEAKAAVKAAKTAKPSAIEAAALAVAADPSPAMVAAFMSLVAKAAK